MKIKLCCEVLTYCGNATCAEIPYKRVVASCVLRTALQLVIITIVIVSY